MCRIKTDWEGLYHGPVRYKEFEAVGNGLYLMKQGGMCDVRGLILGPKSPFKNPHSWYEFVILLSEKKNVYIKNGNRWNWW